MAQYETQYETVLTSVEDGIGLVTLNRPEARNALNGQVLEDLRGALAEPERSGEV